MSQPDRPALPPLQGGRLIFGTLALSLAVFMIILDSSVANVSIQAISGDIGVSPQQGTWVVTSFAVANAIAIPLTGWLTMRIGQVRLFVGANLLFVVSSWLCGIAPNIESLIAARLLQGAAAGPIIPLSQALLLPSYPPARMGMALAFWGTTTLVAPIMGPLLGGWISDNHTWPWIFYINIPIGLLTAWATWAIYRTRESATRQLPIDKLGLVLLALWVGSLQLMLDKGKELDWFNSPVIVALAVTALVGFVYFIVWEWYDAHPVVDLSLFKGRNFSSGVIALSVTYGLFFASLVVLPLWLQTQIGYTATEAGKVMAPVGIFAIVLTPLVGKLLPKIDARWFATCGLLVFALVFHLRARFISEIDAFSLMIPTVIQGAAMAMFFTPLNSIILSGLRPDKIASAAGVFIFVRTMFGGLATSIVSTLWDRRTVLHHARLAEHTGTHHPPFDQSVQTLTAQGMTEPGAWATIDRMITVQASTLGATDIFWMSSVLFLSMIGLVWLTKPIKSAA
ncbi:MAG TPA: DHA2 family efflux MFS transporter permease subunit [Paucimonas sp.]|nr:DHA2 family efflux MFS transporter permease subunit [Paucimonas sp.]